MNLKKRLFWLVSRTGLFLYSRFPVFGRLQAALAVIKKDGVFLMIERNDGRGLSFPGGLRHPWEDEERTLKREVLEETGLQITQSALRFRFSSNADVPVEVAVYEVEAEGAVRGSWEGTPRWFELPAMRQAIIPGQRQVIEAIETGRLADQ